MNADHQGNRPLGASMIGVSQSGGCIQPRQERAFLKRAGIGRGAARVDAASRTRGCGPRAYMRHLVCTRGRRARAGAWARHGLVCARGRVQART